MDQRPGEFLLDGPEQPRRISWWSSDTNVQTSWHGLWFSPTADTDKTISGNFDFAGRAKLSLQKWFKVHALRPCEGRQDTAFVGTDYKGRVVLMKHIATHTYANSGRLGPREVHEIDEIEEIE